MTEKYDHSISLHIDEVDKLFPPVTHVVEVDAVRGMPLNHRETVRELLQAARQVLGGLSGDGVTQELWDGFTRDYDRLSAAADHAQATMTYERSSDRG